MALIIGTKEIQKAVDSIKNRGAKLDASIQQAGLSVLNHIELHGDTTLADSLFNAMPKGARRLALVEWMLSYGMVRVLNSKNEMDKDALAAGRTFGIDRAKKTDLVAAAETMWFDMKKEGSVQEAFDVQAAVQSLLKRIQGMQDKGSVKIEHADLIAKLTAVIQ